MPQKCKRRPGGGGAADVQHDGERTQHSRLDHGREGREHLHHQISQPITPAIADFHPAANIFPLMEEFALADLAADIAANGLRDPILRHRDGRIIDGRNRWLACARVGVECRHRTYEKDDTDIVPLVVSRNLYRRHLTTAQRAAIAADIANLTRGDNQHSREHPSIEGTSQAEAAKLLGVSRASVERAVAVKRADPELHEKVKLGDVTAGQARAVIAAAATSAPAPAAELAIEPDPGPAPEADRLEATEPNDGDWAWAANDGDWAWATIMAVATLKISGAEATKDRDWSDDELVMADRAQKWLSTFVKVARRERLRRGLRS